MSRAARLAAWAVLTAALLAFCAERVSFSTDITHFLPDGEGAELAQISRELTRSELTRTVVLSVGADDPAVARAAGAELAAALRANPEVAWLRAGADPEFLRSVYELYFPRRLYFLSDAPAQELPQLLSDEGLRAQAQVVRASLALPTSPLSKQIVPADPLGALQRQLERLQAGEPALVTRDGVFTTQDGKWAVLLLATKHSAFDASAQAPLLAAIGAKFAELRARLGSNLRLEQAGANRFAVDAETNIKFDAQWISVLSFVGVTLLTYVFFRSPLNLLLVMIPGTFGLLVAMAVGIAAYGRLDGMTLAFGGSLIGVTVDYPTHQLILWSLSERGESPWQLTRRLGLSLTMAALTTIASFAGMAFTSFPGFRELGLFSTVGVGAAVFASLFMLPDLLPRRRRVQPVSASLAERMGPWIPALGRHRGGLALVPAAVVVLGGAALPRLTWHDDLSKMSRLDPAMQAEDERVRARVSDFDAGRFVVALGADAEDAAARNEIVHAALAELVKSGKLGGQRSLHDLWFPPALQEANLAALRADPGLPARLDAAFTSAGFKPGATAPFAAALAAAPPPLSLEELRASPLGELAGTLVLDLGERTAVLTYLRDVRDPAALAAALAGIPDVHLFEQRTFLNNIYARVRDHTLRQIAIGSVAVMLLLIVRYRDWRRATAAFLPSLLVPVIVLSGFALAGVETNLLHAVSLLLVMGMGVDYGIFIVDSAEEGEELGATLVSCLLCCLTTILSFGTLALSSQPPLRAIGTTTGAGVALALVLAPVSLLALRVGKAEAPHA